MGLESGPEGAGDRAAERKLTLKSGGVFHVRGPVKTLRLLWIVPLDFALTAIAGGAGLWFLVGLVRVVSATNILQGIGMCSGSVLAIVARRRYQRWVWTLRLRELDHPFATQEAKRQYRHRDALLILQRVFGLFGHLFMFGAINARYNTYNPPPPTQAFCFWVIGLSLIAIAVLIARTRESQAVFALVRNSERLDAEYLREQ